MKNADITGLKDFNAFIYKAYEEMINKVKIKRRTVAFLATIISIILIATPLCGFTLSANAEMNYFGKGTVLVDVVSDESIDVVEDKVQAMLEGYNSVSTRSNVVNLNKISGSENGYTAEIGFQRIDKVKGLGNISYGKFSDLLSEGSEMSELLSRWESGKLRDSAIVVKYGKSSSVVVKNEYNTGIRIRPELVNGSDTDVESLANNSSLSKDKMFIFRLYDVENVSSVTIRFPGKVKAVSSVGLSVIDERTIKLTPVAIIADVTGTNNEVRPQDTIQSFIGYVVFESGVNPIIIAVIIAIVVLIFVVLILMYFYYGYKKGIIKKLRAEDEKSALKFAAEDKEAVMEDENNEK